MGHCVGSYSSFGSVGLHVIVSSVIYGGGGDIMTRYKLYTTFIILFILYVLFIASIDYSLWFILPAATDVAVIFYITAMSIRGD